MTDTKNTHVFPKEDDAVVNIYFCSNGKIIFPCLRNVIEKDFIQQAYNLNHKDNMLHIMKPFLSEPDTHQQAYPSLFNVCRYKCTIKLAHYAIFINPIHTWLFLISILWMQ